MKKEPLINIDADLRDADWTKTQWDLVGIESVSSLRAHLKRMGTSVADFKKLPTYIEGLKGRPWLKYL